MLSYQVSVNAIQFDESSGFLDPLLLTLVRRFVINTKGFTLAVDTYDASWVAHVSDVELDRSEKIILPDILSTPSTSCVICDHSNPVKVT